MIIRNGVFARKILLALGIITISLRCQEVAFSKNVEKSYTFKHEITDVDLVGAILRRLPRSLSKDAAERFLSKQPELILDGGTLNITPPELGWVQYLTVSRLVLRNGAHIYTHGINLQITAILIVSDPLSAIVSFLPSTPVVAEPGFNGKPGLRAGSVDINGQLEEGSSLNVTLNGQPGQGGGPGLSADEKVPKHYASQPSREHVGCSSTLFGGGRGGSGGDGGLLTLRGPIALQRLQINFVAVGGPGGPGGIPGKPGSLGGSGCGDENTSGSLGELIGSTGASGQVGRPGSIGAQY
jgi:hypothetical protein